MDVQYEPPVATLAERLKQAMEFKAINAADLARETNITPASLSHYLNGRYVPKQDKIYKLAKALNVNPAWLQGFNISSKPSAPYNVAAKEIAKPVPDKPNKENKHVVELFDLVAEVNNLQAAMVELRAGIKEVKADVKAHDSERDAFFDKFLSLTNTNQQVVKKMIDTLLQTQATDSDGTPEVTP